jgi:hypothetical protein
LRFIDTYKFNEEDIAYLQRVMPHADKGFFEWLATVDCSKMKVYALKEGSVTFPNIPLLRIEGPLAVGQVRGLDPASIFINFIIVASRNDTSESCQLSEVFLSLHTTDVNTNIRRSVWLLQMQLGCATLQAKTKFC